MLTGEQETVTDETTVTDPPQEEKENGKKAAPSDDSEKVEKKEPASEKPEVPEVELKDVSYTEDGRVAIKVGRSTYYGKDFDEAWDKMLEGVQQKDEAFVKLQTEAKKAKVSASIREPEEEEEEKLPPQPNESEYIQKVFTERGLNVKMLSFTEDEWDEYQDKEGLKDRHIVKIQGQIEAAKNEAARRYYADDTKWWNLSLLKKELTPAVRDMVADSGLDPDEFGDAYEKLLKDPEMRFKNGELNSTAILRSMSKQIVAKLKAQGASTSEVEEQKKRIKAELDERKEKLKPGQSRTQQKPGEQTKTVNGLKDAFDPERWKKVLAES